MNQGQSAGVPIVALSAGALPEQVKACLDAGMNGHLAKPVKLEDLVAVLARWTGAGGATVSNAVRHDDLKARFWGRLVEDSKALATWRDVNALPSEVKPIVHRLAGSAGSFGFHAIGEQAGLLNDALERNDSNWRDLLTALIAELDAELNSDPARPTA